MLIRSSIQRSAIEWELKNISNHYMLNTYENFLLLNQGLARTVLYSLFEIASQ